MYDNLTDRIKGRMIKSVVVTGGSKGIGWSIVKKFASSGIHVVSGSRSIKDDIPHEIREFVHQVKIDVRNPIDHDQLVYEALNVGDEMIAYINNAGFSEWRSLENIDSEFLHRVLETNLMGYFWGTIAAAKKLPRGGSIINISSLAAKRGTPSNSAYVASKFGVAGLTQSASKELGARGIRVNAICPVLVETEGLVSALTQPDAPGFEDVSGFLKSFAASQTSLGRLPTAEEVANLAFFLVSGHASAITGQSINVDCGVLPN